MSANAPTSGNAPTFANAPVDANTETRNYGLLGTIVIHALVACLLFFLTVDLISEEQEFAELAFSSFINAPTDKKTVKKSPAVIRQTSARQSEPQQKKASDIVELPKRVRPTAEPPEIRRTQKDRLQSKDNPFEIGPAKEAGSRLVQADSMERTGLLDGEKEEFDQRQLTNSNLSDRKLPSAEEGIGGRSGRAFSINWLGGGIREKLSGVLPVYPPGLNKEATILLRFIVKPDGSIGRIIPERKGETTLENISIQALKNWRFNKLESQVPQINQEGVITFVFKLK